MSKFVQSITQVGVGIRATRLPAGTDDRQRLLRLAHRASEVCHRYRAPLLAQVSDVLILALTELAVAESRAVAAERAVGAAKVRIADLQRQIRAELFDVPTVRGEAPNLAQYEAER